MQKIQNFEMNFRLRFDACISFNVQPIDLKLKTLVVLDFNDHLYSFLHWECRIGVVLSRHLARSKCKAQRCLHFDACSSGNIQPIDLKLKTLVLLDFNDHSCCFLYWGFRIGIVLSRHLDRSKRKVQRCQDLVTRRYRLFQRRREILCK